MKCQGCGHDYPSTITRCTRCGHLTPRAGQGSSGSRLIEFPRKTRVNVEKQTDEASLPAWRVELNARVRAIKAKRDQGEAEAQMIAEQQSRVEAPPDEQPETRPKGRTVAARQPQTLASRNKQAEAASLDSLSPGPQPSGSPARGKNLIVEAALTRVRRASENASRAALPRIEPARPAAKASIIVDREATARALEPAVETSPNSRLTTAPLPKPAEMALAQPEIVKAPAAVESRLETRPLAEPDDSFISHKEPISLGPLDEIEPLDYLEAEIKKVDRVLSAEFAKNESPSIATHVLITVVDIFAILISSSPFLALVVIRDGNFSDQRTRIAAAAIALLVSFFYFALTQCLAGQTFGMMLTNTRIVDARTFEPISPQRAMLRSAGYIISIAPALLGLAWVVSNRRRRGWHDILSGTFVARDF